MTLRVKYLCGPLSTHEKNLQATKIQESIEYKGNEYSPSSIPINYHTQKKGYTKTVGIPEVLLLQMVPFSQRGTLFSLPSVAVSCG